MTEQPDVLNERWDGLTEAFGRSNAEIKCMKKGGKDVVEVALALPD